MSEDEIKNESSGLLANALFSKGLRRVYQYHKKIAEMEQERGSMEKAAKENIKAQKAFSNAVLMDPAPLLPEQLNKKYLELLSRRYSVNEYGGIDEKAVSESEKKQLYELMEKGFPDFPNHNKVQK